MRTHVWRPPFASPPTPSLLICFIFLWPIHYVENAPIELSAAPGVDLEPSCGSLSPALLPREATLCWVPAGVQELPTSLPRVWILSCGSQKVSLLYIQLWSTVGKKIPSWKCFGLELWSHLASFQHSTAWCVWCYSDSHICFFSNCYTPPLYPWSPTIP